MSAVEKQITAQYAAKFCDMAAKGLKYLVGALEQPRRLPIVVSSVTKGVHIGELVKLDKAWVRRAGIRTIIDVGANCGQFALAAGAVIPDARIYAFEPLPDCCKKLRQKAKAHGICEVFEVALGKQRGRVDFYRSSSHKSSSVLSMSELHRAAFPWTAGNSTITVEMRCLDDFVDQMVVSPKVLLKLDVQGYENEVLKGASRLLPLVDYVLTEVSFDTLYDGQATFSDVNTLLSTAGFSYAGSLDQLLSPIDGRILQADALFVNARVYRDAGGAPFTSTQLNPSRETSHPEQVCALQD